MPPQFGFAHKATQGTCQDRQRNRRRKRYTRAFNNARVALYGLPLAAPAAATNGNPAGLASASQAPLEGPLVPARAPDFVEIA